MLIYSQREIPFSLFETLEEEEQTCKEKNCKKTEETTTTVQNFEQKKF